ncbi:MAG: hypothetical protein AAF333_09165 [Planctomycetota bacterium]
MNKHFTLAFMLTAGLIVGCDQSDVEEATNAVESAVSEAGEATGDVMDEVKEAGEAALEEGKDAVEDVVEAGKDKVEEIVGGSDAGDISLDSLEEGETLDAGQAESAFAKVTKLIKDQNFDDAEKWIAALEKVGLPEGYADKLVGLKDTLSKAKELGGASDLLKGIGG